MLIITLQVTYSCMLFFFFFFKQKTAYEMLRSLVGSEMCIRDSHNATLFYTLPQISSTLKLGSPSRVTSTLRAHNNCSSAILRVVVTVWTIQLLDVDNGM
eukprot:TRINITY_DN6555_c0_g1_i1.p2 TRINITY_DN6555_c0_g1~~TRINITY_DN6555_c0_g1_i1.p2  ORF type:complete len:100 (-),score=30.66 TRINITY_DN6555_c0_g1_i1:354-653(-)